jgi:ABC-type bacteriocin/lantibiotic exporter with double-glycine peptidase domain
MAFEKFKENIDSAQEFTKEYVEKNVAYYKLWFFKVAMQSTTLLLRLLQLALFILIFLVFCSFAFALFIGELLHSLALGFLITGILFLLLGLLIYRLLPKFVESKLLSKFSEIFFTESHEKH